MLFEYRVTPHPATKKAPAEMLMGHRIRTALDVVRSDSMGSQMDEYRVKVKEWYDRKARDRKFKTGDQAYIRNYAAKGEKCMPRVITEVVSTNT